MFVKDLEVDNRQTYYCDRYHNTNQQNHEHTTPSFARLLVFIMFVPMLKIQKWIKFVRCITIHHTKCLIEAEADLTDQEWLQK